MKRFSMKVSGTVMLTLMLLASATFADQAGSAKGVLEEGQDHIRFDLTLTVNITQAAFNITKKSFGDEKEAWVNKWEKWKNRWEEKHELQWKGRWRDHMKEWASWKESWKQEWGKMWRAEWNETWNPEWKEKWEEWEEWMKNWKERWNETEYEHFERIPEFIRPRFKHIMMEKFRELWENHVNAPLLARCWDTRASRLGLKTALRQALNKTLQRIYNTSDVYVRNFNMTIDLLTSSTVVDGTYTSTGIFNLTQSFDLYGVVTQNSSGTFIRSQFRSLNVTEKVDGKWFGYPGWVFTPGKAMFLDLSVFSVPFEEWERTVDPTANSTRFTLVRDINVTTPYGSIIVDPELSLVVPGVAAGTGDVIAIIPILPTDLVPVRILVPTVIIATLVLAAYYLLKKKSVMQERYSAPSQTL